MTSYTFTTCPQSNIVTFKDILYCHTGDTLYSYTTNTMSWDPITFSDLPEELTLTESGSFYIELTLPSDKLVLGEYVGDPVEDIPNNCLCPIQTLMSIGCKCGGG